MSGKKSDKPSRNDENRERQRRGQADKFAWLKSAGADRTLSDAAFRALSLCAIHEAGGKGYWAGKRVHLAQLCGMTVRKFDRAIAEAIAKNYIEAHIDPEDRRAHKYRIVTVDERDEMFYNELNEWRREYQWWLNAEERFIEMQYRDWLNAEKHFVQEWLDAEAKFVQEWLDAAANHLQALHDLHQRAYNIAIDRGYSFDEAWTHANQVRDAITAGSLRIETVQKLHAHMTETAVSAIWAVPEAAAQDGNNFVESGNNIAESGDYLVETGDYLAESDQIVANLNAVSSRNDQSPCAHKYFKSVKDEEVLQRSLATPRAMTARASRLAQETTTTPTIQAGQSKTGVDGCRLCNDAGQAVALDGGRVIMFIPDAESEDWDREYPLMCLHSLADNYAAIKKVMRESDLSPNFTGYGEDIDGLDEYYENNGLPTKNIIVDAEMGGAPLRLTAPLGMGES